MDLSCGRRSYTERVVIKREHDEARLRVGEPSSPGQPSVLRKIIKIYSATTSGAVDLSSSNKTAVRTLDITTPITQRANRREVA